MFGKPDASLAAALTFGTHWDTRTVMSRKDADNAYSITCGLSAAAPRSAIDGPRQAPIDQARFSRAIWETRLTGYRRDCSRLPDVIVMPKPTP